MNGVAQTIKAVDVVMNDGIQKMAESTAGKPFQFGVFVNGKSSYTVAKSGIIDVNVKAAGRKGRKTKLGFHFKNDRFRIESTCNAYLDEDSLPDEEFDLMDVSHLLFSLRDTLGEIFSGLVLRQLRFLLFLYSWSYHKLLPLLDFFGHF